MGGSGAAAEAAALVSSSRGAAASDRTTDSGGSPRVAMAAGAAQVCTAPVEKLLRLLLGAGGEEKTLDG